MVDATDEPVSGVPEAEVVGRRRWSQDVFFPLRDVAIERVNQVWSSQTISCSDRGNGLVQPLCVVVALV